MFGTGEFRRKKEHPFSLDSGFPTKFLLDPDIANLGVLNFGLLKFTFC
jgi:hypothetical protein